MKTITNKTQTALPLPDGRMLGVGASVVIEDKWAGSDRIQGWSDAQVVLVEEYVPPVEAPTPEQVDETKAHASGRGPKRKGEAPADE